MIRCRTCSCDKFVSVQVSTKHFAKAVAACCAAAPHQVLLSCGTSDMRVLHLESLWAEEFMDGTSRAFIEMDIWVVSQAEED